MMFLLHKERRLRLQLVLGLLLTLGTISGESECMNCLMCTKEKDKDPFCKETESEDFEDGTCVKTTVWVKGRPVLFRDCWDEKEADCVLAAIGTPGNECFAYRYNSETDSPVDQKLGDAIDRCDSESSDNLRNLHLGRQAQGGEPVEIEHDMVRCFCKTDDCDPVITNATNVPAAKVNGSNTNSSSTNSTTKPDNIIGPSVTSSGQTNPPYMTILIVLPVYSYYKSRPAF